MICELFEKQTTGNTDANLYKLHITPRKHDNDYTSKLLQYI